MLLVVVAVFLLLFELWYMLAYLYAYNQTQERILLAPALQGFVMSVAVTLVVLAMLQLIPFNGWVVLALFVGALLLSLVWRTRVSKTSLPQSYPRGWPIFSLFVARQPISSGASVQSRMLGHFLLNYSKPLVRATYCIAQKNGCSTSTMAQRSIRRARRVCCQAPTSPPAVAQGG
ncbi:hypothetical protein HC891_28485, partial [Candidatus Gracilibacteria bacterium]|nr:hypothetical protein [Candidatus Gracilibacteria bacterium]